MSYHRFSLRLILSKSNATQRKSNVNVIMLARAHVFLYTKTANFMNYFLEIIRCTQPYNTLSIDYWIQHAAY